MSLLHNQAAGGGVSGKAFFRIKAVPETTGLTRPDPAQLHTYADCAHQLSKIPTDVIWKGKGSGFSRPTDNDLVCKIKRALKECIKALNTDELHSTMSQNT